MRSWRGSGTFSINCAHCAGAAVVERGFVITIEAFDWNCPQHITPRFTPAEIEKVVAPLHQRIAELEQALGDKP